MSRHEELPFALARWIKEQREIEEAHRAKMVKKNYEDDKEYMRYMSFIIQSWGLLNKKERLLILNFTTWHTEHRNFSVQQRSAIAAMYMKYHLAA